MFIENSTGTSPLFDDLAAISNASPSDDMRSFTPIVERLFELYGPGAAIVTNTCECHGTKLEVIGPVNSVLISFGWDETRQFTSLVTFFVCMVKQRAVTRSAADELRILFKSLGVDVDELAMGFAEKND